MENKELIYELLEISKQAEIELGYLIQLAKKLEVLEEAKENIFQFSLRFDDNGRSQTFASFYKENLISAILYDIFKRIAKELGIEEEDLVEDYALHFYDQYLDERENNKYVKILLKHSFAKEEPKDIVGFFIKRNKEDFNKDNVFEYI